MVSKKLTAMKKWILFISITSIILVAIINYRIPFFRKNAGPWSIGFGSSVNFPDKINLRKNTVYSLEKLRENNSKTGFLADPFFLKVKDTFYIFFEHQILNSVAEIGLLSSTDGLNYKYRGTVLKQPFHLSYPQVFKYKNDYYMIPETKRAFSVLLYKAKKFPFQWQVCDTLIKNVEYVDPTIYLSDTLNIMTVCDKDWHLYMYEADSLFGSWKLHKDPIVMIGSEARCGGRIIPYKNKLLLPIQNCTEGYGHGVSLYQLATKNGNYEIKKTKNLFLQPSTEIKEFNAGMHHIDIQKIDGKYYYVYDGNRLIDQEKHLNIRGTLKLTYLDIKNLFF